MILKSKKDSYRLINVNTDLSTLDDHTNFLISNHSYFDYVEDDPNIYCVIMDFSYVMSGVITYEDALLATANKLGYFQNNELGELILTFTKTYPENYKNFAIYDYITEKTIFPPTVDYSKLKDLAALEQTKDFSGLYKSIDERLFLVSSTEVYSDQVSSETGRQIDSYWNYKTEPNIVHKFIKVI